MRNLLYLLVAMLLLGTLEAAMACSGIDTPTDEQLFAKASTVFVGHVFRTEEIEIHMKLPGEARSRAVPAVEGTFRLIEILKGQPPENGKVRGPIYIICAMPLLVGLDYLFFLDESNFTLTGLGTGTRFFDLLDKPGLEDKHCRRRECVLAKLREIRRKTPP
jgi:hypothetical protein